MKVEIKEFHQGSQRNLSCPVCGHLLSLYFMEGELKKEVTCWYCGSKISVSIEDETKEVKVEKPS